MNSDPILKCVWPAIGPRVFIKFYDVLSRQSMATQQTRYFKPTSGECWTSVADAQPTSLGSQVSITVGLYKFPECYYYTKVIII